MRHKGQKGKPGLALDLLLCGNYLTLYKVILDELVYPESIIHAYISLKMPLAPGG